MSADQPDLQCRRVVELVTDYLEHALSIEEQNQLEQHLSICGACQAFVDQHEKMVRALSALAENPPAPAPEVRAGLLAAFRRKREDNQP